MHKAFSLAFLVVVVACGPEKIDNPDFDAGHDSGGTGGVGGAGGVGGVGGVGGSDFDGGGGDDAGDAAVDGGFDGGDASTSVCAQTCSGPTAYCDESTMQCVACLESAHCAGNAAGGVCSAGVCVECTSAEGCGEGSVCLTDGTECVECNSHSDCADSSNGSYCGASNTCVACMADAHCTDANHAKCDPVAHTCVPCTDNANCAGVMASSTALAVCDLGRCVQCTETEHAACGTGNLGRPRVCNVLSNRCGTASQTEESAGLCMECVASAQCAQGQVCVTQQFEDQDVGNFCFWTINAPQGPNGSCSSVRPYARSLTNQSTVEGTNANICTLAVTTCPGINAFRNPAVACAPGGTPNHDLCGFSYAGEGTTGNARDAYCEQVPNDTAYRCTVPCLSTDDCRPGAACQVNENPVTCGL